MRAVVSQTSYKSDFGKRYPPLNQYCTTKQPVQPSTKGLGRQFSRGSACHASVKSRVQIPSMHVHVSRTSEMPACNPSCRSQRSGILGASGLVRIGELWVQVKDSASIYKMEHNQGRQGYQPLVSIHANMYLHRHEYHIHTTCQKSMCVHLHIVMCQQM